MHVLACNTDTRGTAPGRVWRKAGLTLIELLVVIAIVGVLASLLLSALRQAQGRGRQILCLNNHRQLALAWLLYSTENDRLPANLGAAETRRAVEEETSPNWVNNVMNWELDPMNTNVDLLITGSLGPYAGMTPSIYRCPNDRALSDLQRGAGWTHRTRSISMNAMVGDAGEFTASGVNVNNPGYRQFFSLAEIPNPSHIFVFLEEHPDSINDGYFLNRPRDREWYDLPASYHDGSANLAFADGHAESHRWTAASTKPAPVPDSANLPLSIPPNQLTDFNWLMERTSYRNYYRRTETTK